MANKHAARLGGDDYQHLYSWYLVLQLKDPSTRVAKVILEDKDARSVDDVTIKYEEGVVEPERFYQLKYHTDYREGYTAQQLITPQRKGESLLEKFWQTWRHLYFTHQKHSIELFLVSDWTWGDDGLGSMVKTSEEIKAAEFLSPQAPQKIKDIKNLWQTNLRASDKEFRDFIQCLRLRLGRGRMALKDEVTERMKRFSLKTDISTLKAIVGIVREWISENQCEITLDVLEEKIKEYDLYEPPKPDQCVSIYMESIEHQAYDINFDHQLLWKKHFLPIKNGWGGHQLKIPKNWNQKLLKELLALKNTVNQKTSCRLVRARGKARLSCWFAFGYVFSSVARYTIEVQQGTNIWRTDAAAKKDVTLSIINDQKSTNGEILDGSGDVVALGIGISGAIASKVQRYMAQRQEKIAALLLLEKASTSEWINSAGEAVAIARLIKIHMKEFVDHWHAKKLLLFYYGPESVACFIGHQLNAIGASVQIMEYQEGREVDYEPSFLLS